MPGRPPVVFIPGFPASWRNRMAPMAPAATRLRRTADFPAGYISVTNVAGFGAPTNTRAHIVSGKTTVNGDTEGDVTVAYALATWLRGGNVRMFSLPVGVYPMGGIPLYHSQIWDAPPMLGLFDELPMGTAPDTFVAAALDADDASMGGQRAMLVNVAGSTAAGSPLIPMKVTFTGLKTSIVKTINGRGTITIPKASLPPATAGTFVRFNAIVAWAGARRREIALMYQKR